MTKRLLITASVALLAGAAAGYFVGLSTGRARAQALCNITRDDGVVWAARCEMGNYGLCDDAEVHRAACDGY